MHLNPAFCDVIGGVLDLIAAKAIPSSEFTLL